MAAPVGDGACAVKPGSDDGGGGGGGLPRQLYALDVLAATVWPVIETAILVDRCGSSGCSSSQHPRPQASAVQLARHLQ